MTSRDATSKRLKHPYRCWCGSSFRTSEVAERHLQAKHDNHGVITFRQFDNRKVIK